MTVCRRFAALDFLGRCGCGLGHGLERGEAGRLRLLPRQLDEHDDHRLQLHHKVATALGKKYVRLAIEDGTLFTESSMADVNSSWIIKVKIEKGKGKTFNLLLCIQEQQH